MLCDNKELIIVKIVFQLITFCLQAMCTAVLKTVYHLKVYNINIQTSLKFSFLKLKVMCM